MRRSDGITVGQGANKLLHVDPDFFGDGLFEHIGVDGDV